MTPYRESKHNRNVWGEKDNLFIDLEVIESMSEVPESRIIPGYWTVTLTSGQALKLTPSTGSQVFAFLKKYRSPL